MEEALRTFAQSRTAIAAVLGLTLATFRWFAWVIPQTKGVPQVYPSLIYRTVSVDRNDAYCQTGRNPGGAVTRNMNLRVYATRYVEARAAWETIRLELDGYHGCMQGITVQLIRVVDENDGYDPPEDDGKAGVHYVDATLQIEHAEPVPTFVGG